MTIDHDHGTVIMQTTIGAGDFKAKCLKLLDDVANSREPLIITKHGKAVAKLVPMPLEPELFGVMAQSVKQERDIVSPLENDWEACR
ncbi:type II toxin-antitoxin system Phd/YefM family antitoxin [Methylobacillus arboreus]|uniref:type II toxin-antitoxin system Phd/YefM family antitoxin n=1 Tax=Methylobacillus arboreus TaxID=755170 RepID=UPI001E35FB24|nr:type II toxin-antitoxin system Phd/YefM family antitoxin [Methylobacillus arboreus]MCB5189344.1 type II toxin-antitoxin system Phd/YefM family antitoxin [Methylobacillus arboreus]